MRKKVNLPKVSPDIGSRIKKVRYSQNARQKSFAELLGCSNSYLSDIEKGRTKPSLELLISITYNTKCDLNWLITGKGSMVKQKIISDHKQKYTSEVDISNKIPVRPIPVLNTVPAGYPETPFDDYVKEWVLIPIKIDDDNAFALQVSGNSMEPIIKNGDYVIISPNSDIDSGDIGAFRINEKVTIKKILVEDDKTYLLSENSKYPPIILGEGDELISIGRVVYQLKNL